MRRLLIVINIGLAALTVTAQENAGKFKLSAVKTNQQVNIDGLLNEDIWSQAPQSTPFYLYSPNDSVPASDQTFVYVLFDEHFIYIGGKAFTAEGKYVVQSLRRDFGTDENDNITIYIDPYNDYTNGFFFGVSPFGVQREGLIANGQAESLDWDNKWFAETTRYDNYWTFEIAIPFKSFRYNDELNAWNINILRNNLSNNERSTWSLIPKGFQATSFAFSGKVGFSSKLPEPGANITLIPYIAGALSEDDISDNKTIDAGFDAKIGVTPSLNLDLTFNPDFSQVEVDRQVTNLSRFEIFFPERRQFFLENQDLFAEGGFGESRPFFSRRIGIVRDTLGNTRQIPIHYGARLSGKIGRDWRVGLLNMQTGAEDNAVFTGAESRETDHYLPAQNYTIGVVQRRIFGRSNIGAVFANRQSTGVHMDDTASTVSRYNRVFGFDYNLFSVDNKWEGDFFYHRSFDPDSDNDQSYSSGAFLRYDNSRVNIAFMGTAIGEGYNAELGYIQRKDIIRTGTFSGYNFYPASGKILQHGPNLNFFYTTDTEFNKTDVELSLSYEVNFINTASLGIQYENTYELLRRPFDPSSVSEVLLLEGEDFSWSRIGIYGQSDQRKMLNAAAEISHGGFYNGQRFLAAGEINYRYQPYGQLSLAIEYNNLSFQEPFEDTNFFLIGPKLDLTFTKNIFLTTFVQYNEQIDNVNINARFQWRYKPVSDLFVVYTENYIPAFLFAGGSKNRALVFKWTYWLNL